MLNFDELVHVAKQFTSDIKTLVMINCGAVSDSKLVMLVIFKYHSSVVNRRTIFRSIWT